MEKNIEKIRPALLAMEPGQTISFPIARLKSVRTQASELGAIYERQYTTSMNRSERVVSVTRIS